MRFWMHCQRNQKLLFPPTTRPLAMLLHKVTRQFHFLQYSINGNQAISLRSISPRLTNCTRHSGFRSVAEFTLEIGAPLIIWSVLVPWITYKSQECTFLTGISTRLPFKVYGISSTWMIWHVPVGLSEKRSREQLKMEHTRAGTWRGLRLDLISKLIFFSSACDSVLLSQSLTKRITRSSVPPSIDCATTRASSIASLVFRSSENEKHVSRTLYISDEPNRIPPGFLQNGSELSRRWNALAYSQHTIASSQHYESTSISTSRGCDQHVVPVIFIQIKSVNTSDLTMGRIHHTSLYSAKYAIRNLSAAAFTLSSVPKLGRGQNPMGMHGNGLTHTNSPASPT